ncbi:MAG TPA: methyltransferase domain-containing protein [Chloroflexota bacterium]|jgi:SAM-dependent methyltransferase
MDDADRSGTGLRKRLFAALLARATRWHEPLLADRKRALLGDLRGRVLEIGPGTGVNLAYLPDGVTWIGVEPNAYLRERLRARAAARPGLVAEVRAGTAERLPVPDRSVDAVVSTLVLCSVPDPGAALREVRRVLRPGGRFVFVEHVGAPPGTWLRRLQRAVRPIWSAVADGCHPDRDTLEAVERAGFADVRAERFRVSAGLAAPHVAGTATAPA